MKRSVVITTFLVALALVGCGGGGDDTSSTTPTVVPTTEATPSPAKVGMIAKAVASPSITPDTRFLSTLKRSSVQQSGTLTLPTLDATVFMNWVESAFPEYVPDHQATIAQTGFVYRYYPKTGNYVAVDDSRRVYVLGPVTDNTLVELGKLENHVCNVFKPWCENGGLAVAKLSMTPVTGSINQAKNATIAFELGLGNAIGASHYTTTLACDGKAITVGASSFSTASLATIVLTPSKSLPLGGNCTSTSTVAVTGLLGTATVSVTTSFKVAPPKEVLFVASNDGGYGAPLTAIDVSTNEVTKFAELNGLCYSAWGVAYDERIAKFRVRCAQTKADSPHWTYDPLTKRLQNVNDLPIDGQTVISSSTSMVYGFDKIWIAEGRPTSPTTTNPHVLVNKAGGITSTVLFPANTGYITYLEKDEDLGKVWALTNDGTVYRIDGTSEVVDLIISSVGVVPSFFVHDGKIYRVGGQTIYMNNSSTASTLSSLMTTGIGSTIADLKDIAFDGTSLLFAGNGGVWKNNPTTNILTFVPFDPVVVYQEIEATAGGDMLLLGKGSSGDNLYKVSKETGNSLHLATIPGANHLILIGY